jgi:hypothetical protein
VAAMAVAIELLE